MRKRILCWIAFSFVLFLSVGMASAQETEEYKLNMKVGMEKTDRPVTLFGDLAASPNGFKLGVRYKAMPDVYVGMHLGLGEDRPLDLEVVYRANTGMNNVRVYGGLGVDLKGDTLFGGYLVGGVEATIMFLEMAYHTGGGKLTGWGGVRLPIF